MASRKQKAPATPAPQKILCRAIRCPVCGKRCAFWRRLRKLRWEPGELVPFIQRYHRKQRKGENTGAPWVSPLEHDPSYRAEWTIPESTVVITHKADGKIKVEPREALV